MSVVVPASSRGLLRHLAAGPRRMTAVYAPLEVTCRCGMVLDWPPDCIEMRHTGNGVHVAAHQVARMLRTAEEAQADFLSGRPIDPNEIVGVTEQCAGGWSTATTWKPTGPAVAPEQLATLGCLTFLTRWPNGTVEYSLTNVGIVVGGRSTGLRRDQCIVCSRRKCQTRIYGLAAEMNVDGAASSYLFDEVACDEHVADLEKGADVAFAGRVRVQRTSSVRLRRGDP